MSLVHSPRRTRTQTAATASEMGTLSEILQELARFREEQREEREQFQMEMQQRDVAFQKMEQQLNQLSRSNFILSSGDRNENPLSREEISASENASLVNLGYKLKPDTFDGTGSLREFFSQFILIADANNWSEKAKIIALASCLRGKARSILDCIPEIEKLSFEELKSKLELRFGEGHLSGVYYTQFINRHQKFGEDLSELGADIERLSRLAYSECEDKIREKIACAQFVNAINNGFIKRTLQLEGITSLKLAIERAKIIKEINENEILN